MSQKPLIKNETINFSGHLVEQVIHASSGNNGDVITLIRHAWIP